MARADVRVRVRPGVIRVRITDTRIRAVIRVTAPQHQPPFLPSTYWPPSLDQRGSGRTPGGQIFSIQRTLCITNVRTAFPKN